MKPTHWLNTVWLLLLAATGFTAWLGASGALRQPSLVLMALVFGQPRWDGSALLWGYFAYAVLVLSVGGATLLIWLMRHGEATRTAALLLIVPPLTALQSWAILGETLVPLQVLGFALTIVGVALVRRS